MKKKTLTNSQLLYKEKSRISQLIFNLILIAQANLIFDFYNSCSKNISFNIKLFSSNNLYIKEIFFNLTTN